MSGRRGATPPHRRDNYRSEPIIVEATRATWHYSTPSPSGVVWHSYRMATTRAVCGQTAPLNRHGVSEYPRLVAGATWCGLCHPEWAVTLPEARQSDESTTDAVAAHLTENVEPGASCAVLEGVACSHQVVEW